MKALGLNASVKAINITRYIDITKISELIMSEIWKIFRVLWNFDNNVGKSFYVFWKKRI